MAALGEPQRGYPVVHVSGTNGKFSVVRMTEAILAELGLTVGSYISPHLETVRERITVGGEMIDDAGFAGLVDYLRPYIELVEADRDDHLTYFETLTVMAFEWFSDRVVHAAVVETGLGGEYDATNVADARVAVLTGVSLDHVKEFGGDLARATWEKAGIVKEGSAVVTGVTQPELLRIVEERASERGASSPIALGRDVHVEQKTAVGGQVVNVRGLHGVYPDLYLPLHGPHQAANAALAVVAAEAFAGEALRDEDLAAALGSVSLPGRIEVAGRRPLVVLDGGHNPESAHAVKDAVREAFAYERLVLVVGMLEDKLVEDVLDIWAGVPDLTIVTAPADDRAAPPDRVKAALEAAGGRTGSVLVVEGVAAALDRAIGEAGTEDLVLVFGSFYTVGEARARLRATGSLPDHR